ncbi:E3 ubiquitin-protein ligase RNF31 isoform X2 [Lepisosteus oculatus]|uniref:E3 ubiquitin-protein ligase RNF31 isoform X2 n=1 Tax=Lepisosteus oculatus TaxID=7918 RepID=UPI003715643E
MTSSAVARLEELRDGAVAFLATGSTQEVRPAVEEMASLPLPLAVKYSQISAEAMVRENCAGANHTERLSSLQKLSTALNILEKYGCNLVSPSRPRYWRTVKHNNPVFRATVDSIQGGRAVLYLYGYANQQADGLSFPDDVLEPDTQKVAAVTLEVMCLRLELDLLIKGAHSHPEAFGDALPPRGRETEPPEQEEAGFSPDAGALAEPGDPKPLVDRQLPPPALSRPAEPPKPEPCPGFTPKGTVENCTLCGMFPVSLHCPSCVQWLCTDCDRLYHTHPSRGQHRRSSTTSLRAPARLPQTSSPPQSLSVRSPSAPWTCVSCTCRNESLAVLCVSCERPRTAPPAGRDDVLQASQVSVSQWQCQSCTMVNPSSSVLCEVCERPRLASRPPVTSAQAQIPPVAAASQLQWECQYCTFANTMTSSVCEVCNLSRYDPTPHVSLPCPQPSPALLDGPVVATPPKVPPTPLPKPMEDADWARQNKMKEEGLQLVKMIREAEARGVSPEEVFAAVSYSGTREPCRWLCSELPMALDLLCDMASGSLGGARLSRQEARQAWVSAGGDLEKAVRQALRDRQAKVRELATLGFTDMLGCHDALRLSGGEVRGALSLLQRPLLEPFHQRVWSEQPESHIDVHHQDKQRVLRRLLAVYELPSWGRCELALSLLLEPGASYSLEDVVQAVRESQDRDFIRRLLSKECPICFYSFPQSKMQALISCQCTVCSACFQQHFTIAVRDKHIRDMVCPVCGEPDINNQDQFNSYFSTLDIQLRDCLDSEVYELFHKKLTEQALLKDPKFLWCSHCTFGFIYDGDQLKVTCPQCRKSFCAQCKKPWEQQHAGLTCDQFQLWKRENDPEYQRQGLAGYLRDNGITCPNCRFQYALSKGGCMHFTCSQCRHQFCSGCNNPFHTTACSVPQCSLTGLHAHHPRDCFFYLRDWEPARLQALLQKNNVEFNTEPPPGSQAGLCGVMEQKEEGVRFFDAPCGAQTQAGQAGLCEKHYREYLVSLINGHSLDPAPVYDLAELGAACRRYQLDGVRGDAEDDGAYSARLLRKLMADVPLGDKVPRKK